MMAAMGAKRSAAPLVRLSTVGEDASSVAAATWSMCRMAMAGSP
jgi:hypothetical protein